MNAYCSIVHEWIFFDFVGKIAFIFFEVEYTHNWMLSFVKVDDKKKRISFKSIVVCENLRKFVARFFYYFISNLESTKYFLLNDSY